MASVRRLLLAVLVLGLAPAAGAAPPFFSGIGDAPGGDFDSSANAVSNSGVVAASVEAEEVLPPPLPGLPPLVLPLPQGAIWTAAGGLELLPVEVAGALDISQDGNVVLAVGPGNSGDFLYTDAGGLMPFPAGVKVRALSASGTTVVGRLERPDLTTTEAFHWTAATGVQGLGFLPHANPRSQAYAVSNNGSVVAGDSRNIQLSPGFRWTAGVGMEHMDSLAIGPQNARVISGIGDKIAGLSNGDAYIWSAAQGYTWLGNSFNPGIPKIPADMNLDGSVVVGGNTATTFSSAFIWDPVNGMRELADVLETQYGLDLTGWTLLTARGISANGRWIVGEGINPAGDDEGWVVYLGSPACGLGFEIAPLVGLLAHWRSRRRRRQPGGEPISGDLP